MHEASIIYPLVRESHIEPFNAVYNGVITVVLDGGSLGNCHQHSTVRPRSVTNIQASTSGPATALLKDRATPFALTSVVGTGLTVSGCAGVTVLS